MALQTILTTAAITLGAVAAARHLRRKAVKAAEKLRRRDRGESGGEDTIEFIRDPETGAYHHPDKTTDN